MYFYKAYPSDKLLPYINYYWCVKGSALSHIRELPPQLHLSVCFHKGIGCPIYKKYDAEILVSKYCADWDKYDKANDNKQYSFRTSIIGPHTDYVLELMRGEIFTIGVEFRPCVFETLWKVPASCMFGTVSSPAEMGIADLLLLEHLVSECEDDKIFEVLNDYFEFLFGQKAVDLQYFNYLQKILDTMECSVAGDYVKKVSEINGYNTKQYYRLFSEHVGVPPTKFVAIKRFYRAIDVMKNQKNANLLDIALESGFYDLTHMNRIFRHFCGNNASHVRNNFCCFHKDGDEYIAIDIGGNKYIWL